MALRRWLWIYILCTGRWAPHGAWLCFHCTINFGKDAWWMFIRPSRFWFVVLTSHSREWLNGIQSLGAGNTNVINYRTRRKLGNEFEFFIFFFLKTYVSASWSVRSWSRAEWGLFGLSVMIWECAGSGEWVDFHCCPKLWVWAVRFGESHRQILKLDLKNPALLFVPHWLKHQPPTESWQSFPTKNPFASCLWDWSLCWRCQAETSAGLLFTLKSLLLERKK